VTALHHALFAGAALTGLGALAVGWLVGVRKAAPARGAGEQRVPAGARLWPVLTALRVADQARRPRPPAAVRRPRRPLPKTASQVVAGRPRK
jgi:hypothetical protein